MICFTLIENLKFIYVYYSYSPHQIFNSPQPFLYSLNKLVGLFEVYYSHICSIPLVTDIPAWKVYPSSHHTQGLFSYFFTNIETNNKLPINTVSVRTSIADKEMNQLQHFHNPNTGIDPLPPVTIMSPKTRGYF